MIIKFPMKWLKGFPMDLFELLQKIIRVFENLSIPYLVTGSVASMAYGEPRLTNDIDIVADIRLSHIPGLLAAFPQEDYYIDEEMIRDAIYRIGQFNIIHPASGLKIDVIIKQDIPFDQSRFERIRKIYPGDYSADFASPEDVIIKKLEYYKLGGSEKHLRDIAGIFKISGEIIDKEYIFHWATKLDLKEILNMVLERMKIDTVRSPTKI
jgi:hypothetical protein